MGYFGQFRESRFLVDELFTVQIAKFRAVEANAEVSTEHPFTLLLIDSGKCVVKFATKRNNCR